MLKEHNQTVRNAALRAFTLVELIIVVLIIAIVIAISLPALGMAKTAAKKHASQVLATELGSAITTFQSEFNRLPGYFSAADMGSPDNADRGFTALENAMLELVAGSMVPSNATGTLIEVGPTKDETVFVDLDLIGANTQGDNSYFSPDVKSYVAQDGILGGEQEAIDEHKQLPDLVDAFGSPVLLWAENEATRGSLVQSKVAQFGTPFALVDSGSNLDKAARYYWNSNSGFLNSTKLGEMERSQVMSSNLRYSLIGGGNQKTDLEESLMGMLGSPSNADVDMDGVQPEETVPGNSRGGFTIQMAGPDGMYVSSTDRGASRLSNSKIEYWRTWYDASGSRVTNEDGKPASKDLIVDAFDDFLLSGAR